MRRSEKINIWIFRIAAVLLCLTVMSVWGTSRLYARYSTSASGSDGARVAKFAVSAAPSQGQSTDFGMVTGENSSADYVFTVTGNSEVTVKYDVVVTFPAELKGVNLTLKNGDNVVPAKTSDNMIFTYVNVGEFSAGTVQTDSLTLTFTTTDTATDAAWNGIKIDVYAEQVD